MSLKMRNNILYQTFDQPMGALKSLRLTDLLHLQAKNKLDFAAIHQTRTKIENQISLQLKRCVNTHIRSQLIKHFEG